MDTRQEFLKFKAEAQEAQKKLDKIERYTSNCDPRLLGAVSDIDVFLDRNKQFKTSREYSLIMTDSNIVKSNIMTSCICKCPTRR